MVFHLGGPEELLVSEQRYGSFYQQIFFLLRLNDGVFVKQNRKKSSFFNYLWQMPLSNHKSTHLSFPWAKLWADTAKTTHSKLFEKVEIFQKYSTKILRGKARKYWDSRQKL